MLWCTLLYVPPSFAIILMGKRELVALLSMSSWCLVIVSWLFLAVPWVCLQFMIVVFPDHTPLLFYVLGYFAATEACNSLIFDSSRSSEMSICSFVVALIDLSFSPPLKKTVCFFSTGLYPFLI